jgi:hypothetical protein
MKKIKLTKGKYALIDDVDFEIVSKYKWCVGQFGNTYCAMRKDSSRNTVYMHRLIMNTPFGKDTDHINGNGLDNRRKNLRVCTHSQNLQNQTRVNIKNTSGVSGVYWDKQLNKWRARAKVSGKNVHLGLFSELSKAKKSVLGFKEKQLCKL